jgi:hypothetical protein
VPDRYIVARAALALLVIAGALELYSAAHHYSNDQGVASSTTDASAATVLPDDEQLLPGLGDWHLTTRDDFDASIGAWMHEHGKDLTSRITGSFAGPGEKPGTGYVLARNDDAHQSPWRVAMLSQGRSVVDATFPGVIAVVLVPQEKLATVRWTPSETGAPGPPDGDGLMMIRRTDGTESATILYLSNGKVQSGVPADFWSVEGR